MIKFLKFMFKAILMLTGMMGLVKCNQKQESKDGKIVFHGQEFEDENFVILNDVFAKDLTKVYYKKYVIPDCSPEGFEFLDENYGKNKTAVFYCDEYRVGQDYYLTKKSGIIKLKEADPQSFIAIGNGYAKDKKYAYFEGNSFSVSDLESFKGIDNLFSIDNLDVYYAMKRIPGADGKTFEILNSHYAKDSYQYYYYGFPSEVISFPVSFASASMPLEILPFPYSKNEKNVFYQNEAVVGLNGDEVTVLDYGYAKDNNKVFYCLEQIKNADPTSFTIPEQSRGDLDSELFSFDKNSVYYATKKIVGASPIGFEILGLDYIKDQNHIYYKWSQVAQADLSTFKVYQHGFGDEDAEDKSFKYSKGKKVGKI